MVPTFYKDSNKEDDKLKLSELELKELWTWELPSCLGKGQVKQHSKS